MKKIIISENKLIVQSEITLRNIIIAAVLLVVISMLFWFFANLFTWIFITVFANIVFAVWIFLGLFWNDNQMEIDFEKKTLLRQSKIGSHVLKSKLVNDVIGDTFWMRGYYQNGKYYNLYYGENKDNWFVWRFSELKANRVNAWLNQHRKFPVEIE